MKETFQLIEERKQQEAAGKMSRASDSLMRKIYHRLQQWSSSATRSNEAPGATADADVPAGATTDPERQKLEQQLIAEIELKDKAVSKAGELAKRHSSLQKQFREEADKYIDLKTNYDRLDQSLKEAHAKLASATTERGDRIRASMMKGIDKLKAKNKDLTEATQVAQTLVAAAQADLRETMARLEAMEQKKKKYKKQLKKLEQHTDELETSNSDHRDTIINLLRQLGKARAEASRQLSSSTDADAPPKKNARGTSNAIRTEGATSDSEPDEEQHAYSMGAATMEVVLDVNGRREVSLFDTGCSLTYMSNKLLNQIGATEVLPPKFATARTANGGLVHFDAMVKLPVNMKERSILHEFHVTDPKNCPSDIVMGKDRMLKMATNGEVNLNFRLSRIEFDDDYLDMLAPMAFINALVEEQEQAAAELPLIARVADEVVIPSRGDYHVRAEVDGELKSNSDYIVEERPHAYTAKVGKIFIKPPKDRKTVYVRVLNMSHGPVKLHKGARIAALSEAVPAHEHKQKRTEEGVDPHYVPKEADIAEWFEPPTDEWPEQVRKLDLSESAFTYQEPRELEDILLNHPKAFVQPDGRIGRYRGPVQHRIRVKRDAAPSRRRAVRLPLSQQDEVRKQLQQLIDDGMIRPSDSPHAAPVILVRKKDGSYRMVCDYRGLNETLEDQCFVLANIQTLIDSCAGQKYFTTVDFAQRYQQVSVYPPDIPKTAFVTEHGLFEWLVTPFGMKHSGETFNRMMKELARQVQFRLLCFVDDVTLCAPTAEQHLQDIDSFLDVIEANGLTLKLKKCIFGTRKVNYVGVIVGGDEVEMDPEKIAAILEKEPPTNLTELRKFLGVVNYFRRHIKDCAKILGPLYELTKGERMGEWTEQHQEAFDKIKKIITSAPVLTQARVGEPYVLEVDASKVGLGACLLQKDSEGAMRVIAYASRKTNKHEQNYHSTELEACAMTWALGHFAAYLIGAPKSLVRTDNAACVAMLTKHDESLTSRMNKYRLAIQAYDVAIEHRSGKTNVVADYLSRYPREGATDQSNCEEQQQSNGATTCALCIDDLRITLPRIRAEQKRDTFTKPLYDAIAHKKFPQQKEQQRQVEKQMHKYILKNDVLYFAKPAGTEPRIALPQRFHETAVRELHGDLLQGGHLGADKTLEKLKERFFWPNMKHDTAQLISSCPECQFRKTPSKLMSKEPLKAWPAPQWPTQRVHLDILGPLPLSQGRFRYVLTATDALTKWIGATPLKQQTAEQVNDAFIRDVICKFGVPTYVVTDGGSCFMSQQFRELAEAYSFKHIPVSTYHQAANGQIEKHHATLADMISAYANDHGTNWCKVLAPLTFAYNCSVHKTTGKSPFWTMFGRSPCLPIDLRTRLFQEEQLLSRGDEAREGNFNPQEAESNVLLHQSEEVKKLRAAWTMVRNVIEEKTKLRDAYRNEKDGAKEHQFEAGDFVLRKRAPERVEHKFAAHYDGPYQILEVNSPNAMIQKLTEGGRIAEVHMDQLKQFRENISLPSYDQEPDKNSEREADVNFVRATMEQHTRIDVEAAAKRLGLMALRAAEHEGLLQAMPEGRIEELACITMCLEPMISNNRKSNVATEVSVSIKATAKEIEETASAEATEEDEETAEEEADSARRATTETEQRKTGASVNAAVSRETEDECTAYTSRSQSPMNGPRSHWPTEDPEARATTEVTTLRQPEEVTREKVDDDEARSIQRTNP